MLTAFTTQSLFDAAKALSDGQLVSFPTETVYGLGADATNDEAVAKIYQAKGRPSFNPLIAHIASMEQAEEIGAFDDRALRLADAFWPGALTIIVPSKPSAPISHLVTAGLDTIALRLPAPPLVQELIAKAGVPIAAPSANLSGKISPTLATHVEADLGPSCAYILDGGPCEAGVESTIIDCSNKALSILRPGPITHEMVAAICPELGDEAIITNDIKPNAPGQLTSHYAPTKPVRLNVTDPQEGDIFIGFGPSPHKVDFTLSSKGDLIEAASLLFATLHKADKAQGRAIAIAPIDKDGVGAAINDRLTRAAADR